MTDTMTPLIITLCLNILISVSLYISVFRSRSNTISILCDYLKQIDDYFKQMYDALESCYDYENRGLRVKLAVGKENKEE